MPKAKGNPSLVLELDDLNAETAHGAALAAVDEIRLGEPVCMDRWRLRRSALLDAVKRCVEAGLCVSVSTPALLMSDEGVRQCMELTAECLEAGATRIVINNLGMLHAAEKSWRRQYEIIAGQFLNAYNHLDVNLFAELGVSRVCLPVDLRREEVLALVAHARIPVEILVHGSAVAAVSRRCYGSQVETGDPWSCAGTCIGRHELPVLSDDRTERPVFRIWGRSLLTEADVCLLAVVGELVQGGVGFFRVSGFGRPLQYLCEAARVYVEALTYGRTPRAGNQELASLPEHPRFCNGWYYSRAGLEAVHGD